MDIFAPPIKEGWNPYIHSRRGDISPYSPSLSVNFLSVFAFLIGFNLWFSPLSSQASPSTHFQAVNSDNLLQSPSFEYSVSGWSFGNNTGGYYDTQYVMDGSYYVYIYPTRGNSASIYQDVSAAPGEQYILTFYAAVHYVSNRQYVRLQFLDEEDEVLSEESVEIDHDVDVDGAMASYQLLGVAPEGTETVRVKGTVKRQGYNYYAYLKLDGFVLTRVEGSGGSSGALPVEWAGFDVSYKDQVASLTWATASEANASHFEVERALDGVSFQSIGRVQAVGNTQDLTSYSFIDTKVGLTGADRVYYRLKQEDFDGKVSYSTLVSIRVESSIRILTASIGRVFPNPTKGRVQLQWNSSEAVNLIEVYNTAGQLVKRTSPQQVHHAQIIELSTLSIGFYSLVMHTDYGSYAHRIQVVD